MPNWVDGTDGSGAGSIFRIDGPSGAGGRHSRARARHRAMALAGQSTVAASGESAGSLEAANFETLPFDSSDCELETKAVEHTDTIQHPSLAKRFRQHFTDLNRLAMDPIVWEVEESLIATELRQALALTESGLEQLAGYSRDCRPLHTNSALSVIERNVGERAQRVMARVEQATNLRRAVLRLSASLIEVSRRGVPLPDEINDFARAIEQSVALGEPTLFAVTESYGAAERVAAHSLNVATMCAALLQGTADADAVSHVAVRAALLQDFGMMALPRTLLDSSTPLSLPQRQVVDQHTSSSVAVAARVYRCERTLQAIYQHHERLDGSGYPERVLGDSVALPARLLAVADTFLGMCEPRPYRRPFGTEQALHELQRAVNDGKLDGRWLDRLFTLTTHWLVVAPGHDTSPGAGAIRASAA